MHILKNTQGELSIVFDAGYADADDVAVAIVDAAGNVVVAAGAAVKDPDTAGRYTYLLAPQAEVASLTVTWSGIWNTVAQSVDTSAEIVGSQLFTLAQLRDYDDRKLASLTFTDELLAAKRDEITDFFEQVCNVSFVRRYARDELEGQNRRIIYLMNRRPTRLLSATVNGQALSDDDFASIARYDSGKIERPTPWPYRPVQGRNVVVAYEYGWQMPPAKISEAAKLLARLELMATDIGDRTLSVTNDLGTVRLSVPGAKYPTGIPVVDATLGQYDETSDIEAF